MDHTFSILSGVGVLAGGLGFAYAQFKSGANKAKDDLVHTLRESLDVEKNKIKELTETYGTQINTLNKEVGRLQGLHESNERKIKEYMEILQGRNPEMEKFMIEITATSRNAEKYMENSTKILSELIILNKNTKSRLDNATKDVKLKTRG